MKDAVVIYLPWALSVITIYMNVLAGNKNKLAWLFGLLNQLLWMLWILTSGNYGLIPMNIALWVVYSRNYVKWDKNKGGAE